MEILFTAEEIKQAVEAMAHKLDSEFRDKNPLFICTLKGAFVFTADLVRAMETPCQVEFMSVSSYNEGTVSSGNVNIKKDVDCDIKGRHVIITEDIIDTGNTLFKLKKLLLEREPASLKICTFLDKPSRRTADISSDYTCFEIPDKFVIGYGMDVGEKYRELPYVGVYSGDI